MPRFLGVDCGTKRVGIALSDESGNFAFPYSVLEADKGSLQRKLAELCKKEKVHGIVVGLPTGFNGQDTAMTKQVRAFADSLKILGLPVVFENEILSSREAAHGGTKKEKIDAAAAAIILQSYLERRRHMLE